MLVVLGLLLDGARDGDTDEDLHELALLQQNGVFEDVVLSASDDHVRRGMNGFGEDHVDHQGDQHAKTTKITDEIMNNVDLIVIDANFHSIRADQAGQWNSSQQPLGIEQLFQTFQCTLVTR